jgi:predicted transcriptional regulator
MEDKRKRKPRKKKEFRYATSFTMRFDDYTLDMLDKIAYEEDKMRPEIIRASVKYLFLKKFGQKELEKLRQKHRKDLAKADNRAFSNIDR